MNMLRHTQAIRVRSRAPIVLAAVAAIALAGCSLAPQRPAVTDHADDARARAERLADDRRQQDRDRDRERSDGVTALERDMDRLSPAVRMPLGVRSGF